MESLVLNHLSGRWITFEDRVRTQSTGIRSETTDSLSPPRGDCFRTFDDLIAMGGGFPDFDDLIAMGGGFPESL
ncbi:MAG: hypothetical protein D6795_20670 [Deltaproteobacteria bacterium]|nr:MAG: hypothetical protein D6795_20670 [Deltaproteobacteria bacterium]